MPPLFNLSLSDATAGNDTPHVDVTADELSELIKNGNVELGVRSSRIEILGALSAIGEASAKDTPAPPAAAHAEPEPAFDEPGIGSVH